MAAAKMAVVLLLAVAWLFAAAGAAKDEAQCGQCYTSCVRKCEKDDDDDSIRAINRTRPAVSKTHGAVTHLTGDGDTPATVGSADRPLAAATKTVTPYDDSYDDKDDDDDKDDKDDDDKDDDDDDDDDYKCKTTCVVNCYQDLPPVCYKMCVVETCLTVPPYKRAGCYSSCAHKCYHHRHGHKHKHKPKPKPSPKPPTPKPTPAPPKKPLKPKPKPKCPCSPKPAPPKPKPPCAPKTAPPKPKPKPPCPPMKNMSASANTTNN